MKIIEKTTWMPFFKEILTGKKTFDIRLGNCKIEVGDTIVFREYNQKERKFTGMTCKKVVTYKMKLTINSGVQFGKDNVEFWTADEIKKHGLICMGIY